MSWWRLVAASSILVGACGLYESGPSISEGGDGGPDTPLDGPIDIDGGVDSSDAAAVPDVYEAGPCPLGSVLAGDSGFCIDSTETTNGQYQKFLGTIEDAGIPSLPLFCGYKSKPADFTPTAWTKPEEQRPVVGVDWCDAYLYCKWANKRLCGHRGGGSVAPTDVSNNDKSDWAYACTGNTSQGYPYGNTFDASACNGAATGLNKPANAGSFAGCVGGFSGIFDMSGNVWEWVDSCDGTTSGTDHCLILGGSFSNDTTGLRCDRAADAKRSDLFVNTGFRCCAP